MARVLNGDIGLEDGHGAEGSNADVKLLTHSRHWRRLSFFGLVRALGIGGSSEDGTPPSARGGFDGEDVTKFT